MSGGHIGCGDILYTLRQRLSLDVHFRKNKCLSGSFLAAKIGPSHFFVLCPSFAWQLVRICDRQLFHSLSLHKIILGM